MRIVKRNMAGYNYYFIEDRKGMQLIDGAFPTRSAARNFLKREREAEALRALADVESPSAVAFHEAR